MKTTAIAFALCAGLLTLSFSVSAHHSFQAEYDQNQPLKLVGKITKVLQENPHGWIYLDAPNAQGKIVNWALEIPNPFVVQQNGFSRDIYDQLMKSAEVVTVTAYAAKDGSKHAWAGGLTRADGKTVITLSGIPGQGGPRAGRGQQ
jgi:hypothetical protein